jgi:uncharacterized protein YhfF
VINNIGVKKSNAFVALWLGVAFSSQNLGMNDIIVKKRNVSCVIMVLHICITRFSQVS